PNGHGPLDGAPLVAEPAIASAPPEHRPDTHPPREANGFAGNGAGERGAGPTAAAPRPAIAPPIAAPANGEQRRTLHLSLGNSAHGNTGSPPADIHQPEPPAVAEHGPRPAQPAPTMPDNGQDGAALTGLSDIRPAGYPEPLRRNDGEAAPRKEASAFIDRELRARVDGDIAIFLA